MEIKQIKINFKNLKGVYSLNSKTVEICGQNGTGKTTIADAYCWLFTGKNLDGLTDTGKKSFSVIPYGEKMAEVTAIVSEESKETEITRQITIDETGSSKTRFFVDTVELNKKNFDEYVNKLFGADIRIVSVPGAFSEKTTKEQRDILLQNINISFDEVAEERDVDLLQAIKNFGFDEWKKSIKSKINFLKEDLQTQNAKLQTIRELTHEKPQQVDIEDIKKQISELKNNSLVDDYNKKRQEYIKKVKAAEQNLLNLEEQQNAAVAQDVRKKNMLNLQKMQIEGELFQNETFITALRQSFKDTYNQKYEEKNYDCLQCPLDKSVNCNNQILLENLFEMQDKARQNFQEEQRVKLDKINSEGQSIKKKIEDLKANLENIKREIEEKFELPLIDEIKKAHEALEKIKQSEPVLQENENQTRIDELQKMLFEQEQQKELTQKQQEIIAVIETLQRQLGDAEQKQARAEELRTLQMQALEKAVNAHFNNGLEFKLFEPQVNGSVADTCQIYVDGVPYGRGLNRAAQINADLQIIQYLQENYKVNAPVFVDNAESVNYLYNINTQMITLRVTEDEELTIKM